MGAKLLRIRFDKYIDIYYMSINIYLIKMGIKFMINLDI